MRDSVPHKKLLAPADLVDNFTRSLYKIAPYQGCAHGCRYCDGRAERYYVEGDFEKDIVVRDSIPARLAEDLPRVRESGMVAFGSGTTDPYQPCETAARITGQCAELLARLASQSQDISPKLPALIMTKSALAQRDLALWSSLNKSAGVVLLVSLTSTDESLQHFMEPGASSFADRLALLRQFKDAGCATGILAMPLLPGLSDSEESIRTLYEAASQAKVDFILPGGLTLRPGRQKDLYLKTVEHYAPRLLEPTRHIYRSEQPSGWPSAESSRGLMSKLKPIREEFGIPFLLPHAIHARLLPEHDSFRVLLRDMIELYADRGHSVRELRNCAERYDAWLVSCRRYFRKTRKLPTAWLAERLKEAAQSGELAEVLENRKLGSFAASVILEGAIFDYVRLRLE